MGKHNYKRNSKAVVVKNGNAVIKSPLQENRNLKQQNGSLQSDSRMGIHSQEGSGKICNVEKTDEETTLDISRGKLYSDNLFSDVKEKICSYLDSESYLKAMQLSSEWQKAGEWMKFCMSIDLWRFYKEHDMGLDVFKQIAFKYPQRSLSDRHDAKSILKLWNYLKSKKSLECRAMLDMEKDILLIDHRFAIKISNPLGTITTVLLHREEESFRAEQTLDLLHATTTLCNVIAHVIEPIVKGDVVSEYIVAFCCRTGKFVEFLNLDYSGRRLHNTLRLDPIIGANYHNVQSIEQIGSQGDRMFLYFKPVSGNNFIFTYQLVPESTTQVQKNLLSMVTLEAGSIGKSVFLWDNQLFYQTKTRFCKLTWPDQSKKKPSIKSYPLKESTRSSQVRFINDCAIYACSNSKGITLMIADVNKRFKFVKGGEGLVLKSIQSFCVFGNLLTIHSANDEVIVYAINGYDDLRDLSDGNIIYRHRFEHLLGSMADMRMEYNGSNLVLLVKAENKSHLILLGPLKVRPILSLPE